MVVTIDEKIIDVTLEYEKNLKEIIINIDNWLNQGQFIIEKLYVNNQDYTNKDLDLAIENISRIDIKTISFTDLNINNLSWTKYFFEKLIIAVKNWDINILSQVESESKFVLEHIPTLLSLDNIKPELYYSEKLKDLFNSYSYFNCNEEIVNKDEIITFLNGIDLLLTERLNEYTNTKEELKTSIEVLYMLKDEIENVSIFLQTGKAKDAGIIMSKFTSSFHKVLRILNFNLKNKDIVGEVDVLSLLTGIDDILNDLVDGYENKDTVLIGDILEYELTPKIEILKENFC
ncbi:MAG: hypothetical protein JXR64_07560 [Spirochaetales bacterium]|nr:hypothetical protein [Spirochaetales bacterium]